MRFRSYFVQGLAFLHLCVSAATAAGGGGLSGMDFEADAAFPRLAPAASAFTDLLTAEVASRYPGTLDRSAIRQVINEQRLVLGGLSSANLLRLARVSGARYLVHGTVTPGATDGVRVQARLFDSETFETLAVVVEDASGDGGLRTAAGHLAEALVKAATSAQGRPPVAVANVISMTPEATVLFMRGLRALGGGDRCEAVCGLCEAAVTAPDHPVVEGWLQWLLHREPFAPVFRAYPSNAVSSAGTAALRDVAVLRCERLLPPEANIDLAHANTLKPSESDVTEAIERAVLAAGLRLVNSEGMAEAMAEQDLKLSGVLDPQTAARYGRALFPDAAIGSSVVLENGHPVIRMHLMGVRPAGVRAAVRTELSTSGSLTGLVAAVSALLSAAGPEAVVSSPAGWRTIRDLSPADRGKRPDFSFLLTTNGAAAAWTWMQVSMAWDPHFASAKHLEPHVRQQALRMMDGADPADPDFETAWSLFITLGGHPLEVEAKRIDALPASLMRARMQLRLAREWSERKEAARWEQVLRRADLALETLAALGAAPSPQSAAPANAWNAGADMDRIEGPARPAPASAPALAADRNDRVRIELAARLFRTRAQLALGKCDDLLRELAAFDRCRRQAPGVDLALLPSMMFDFLAPGRPPGAPVMIERVPNAYGMPLDLDRTLADWRARAAEAARNASTPSESTDSIPPALREAVTGIRSLRQRWEGGAEPSDAEMSGARGMLETIWKQDRVLAGKEREALSGAYLKADRVRLQTADKARAALKKMLAWYQGTHEVAAGIERVVQARLQVEVPLADHLYTIGQSSLPYGEKLKALRRAEDVYRTLEARGAAAGRPMADRWRVEFDMLYSQMNARDDVLRFGLETMRKTKHAPVMGFQPLMVNLALDRNVRDPSAALAALLRENGLEASPLELSHWWGNALWDMLPRDHAPVRADYERLKGAVGALDRLQGSGQKGIYHARYMVGLGETLDEAAGILRELAVKGGFEGKQAVELLKSLPSAAPAGK